jgi:hypothetical protein
MSDIKTLVRGAYDVQKLRIQMGNRIVGNFKAKLGQAPGTKEEDLEKEEKRILDTLRLKYRKITDGVKTFPRQATFKGDEVISTYTELCLMAQYVALEEQEASHFRRLESVIKEYPIYTQFLEGVRGCGPAMSAVILSEIDIHRSKYASSLWKLAGYDVAADGKGRSKKKEHLVESEYTSKDGEIKKKVGITFNPFLKTKLYVLATCFVKAGDSPYRTAYDQYKNRLENHAAHKDKTKGHRNAMAMRYMIKRFLVDLYSNWRRIEGLEVHPEYSEGKLGYKHAA